MTTIIKNQAATVSVTLKTDGNPVAIPSNATVTAQLASISTGAPLFTPAKTLTSTSDWANGVVSVALTAQDTAACAPPDCMLVVVVNGKAYRFRLMVELANAAPTKSALFVRDFVIDDIRTDRLYAVTESLMPGVSISDDYIWSKILAAEAEIARTLRVELVPTAFFPLPPTDEQIAALNGMPWKEDPAYDYDPKMFGSDRWGFLSARHYPIISVSKLRYAYPTPSNTVYDIPIEWLKLDKKYGQVRIVPTANGSMVLLNSYLLQLLGAGSNIPHMLQMYYVAGLVNAAADFPDLLDAIKKMAVLKIIEDGFLPQSGSISADGLSESMSTDMGKYHEAIDRMLNGADGNGGLMAAIHGVRLVVV